MIASLCDLWWLSSASLLASHPVRSSRLAQPPTVMWCCLLAPACRVQPLSPSSPPLASNDAVSCLLTLVGNQMMTGINPPHGVQCVPELGSLPSRLSSLNSVRAERALASGHDFQRSHNGTRCSLMRSPSSGSPVSRPSSSEIT
jgi:hypothetical protein